MPRDASRQSCMERLLHQPAANAELVAMICDAQTYHDPAASAAEQRRRQLLEEAQQAFERQQEELYQAWLVRHPDGNRRQWQESHQAALDSAARPLPNSRSSAASRKSASSRHAAASTRNAGRTRRGSTGSAGWSGHGDPG